MRKRIATMATMTVLLAACSGTGPTGPAPGPGPRDAAPSFARDLPGTPGEPNCRGQTTAYVAQGQAGLRESRGIGRVGREVGLTVQEVHAAIDLFCNPPPEV